MSSTRPDRGPGAASLAMDLVPVLIAGWIAWRVLSTMMGRLDYPYDLEWMEGGMLGHAWQLAHGRPLYPDPHPGHVAFVYPPAYSAIVAFLSPWFGLDYPLGRAISILGTVAAALAIPVGAWRQGGHWGPGLVGAALYLSLYNASGAFYDLVRPDALAVALLGWSIVLGLERFRGAPIGSGLLLACAFATKHNLAVFGIPLLAHFWLRVSPAAGRRFAAASIGPALAFTVYMHVVSGGNFLKFILGVPGSHPMSGLRGFPGSEMELILYLFPGLAAAAVYLVLRAIPRVEPTAMALPVVLATVLGAWAPRLGRAPGLMYPEDNWVRHVGFVALGLIAGSLLVVTIDTAARKKLDTRWLVGTLIAGLAMVIAAVMRAHHGGFINVLMPLHWATCFGLAVLAGRARNLWPLVGTGLTAAVGVAALMWSGNKLELERLLPRPEDVATGDVVVAKIRACPPGPIYSPYAAWLPVKAGREPSAHLIGVWDINHPLGPFVDDMETFRQAAADGMWSCVVEGGHESLKNGIDVHYRFEERLTLPGMDMMPKTGWRAKPNALLRPREAPGGNQP